MANEGPSRRMIQGQVIPFDLVFSVSHSVIGSGQPWSSTGGNSHDMPSPIKGDDEKERDEEEEDLPCLASLFSSPLSFPPHPDRSSSVLAHSSFLQPLPSSHAMGIATRLLLKRNALKQGIWFCLCLWATTKKSGPYSVNPVKLQSENKSILSFALFFLSSFIHHLTMYSQCIHCDMQMWVWVLTMIC